MLVIMIFLSKEESEDVIIKILKRFIKLNQKLQFMFAMIFNYLMNSKRGYHTILRVWW